MGHLLYCGLANVKQWKTVNETERTIRNKTCHVYLYNAK